ncbi:MAG: multicopper oxidase domain-containing protein [Telluria sp.]
MMRWALPKALACGALVLAGLAWQGQALAAARNFEMNVEDTRITLVEKQQFHTFAFAGQVPGPLFYVDEGDEITVNVNNMTALPHTIHWHGMLQKGTWRMDGVPGITQEGINPGDSFTYKLIAGPSGTMWYHCHVNVNEHVALRGMWGPFIVRPKKPTALEKTVTKEFIMMLSDWDSKYADKPGFGGLPGDIYNYFTINGRSFPETQPLRVNKGDVVRLRLIGAGDLIHSIHLHGHVMKIAFKDGFPLANPILADTVLIGPGERYDVIFTADNPGRWMIHDHVDTHTMNGERPMGGIMSVLEYNEIPRDDAFYTWKDKKFVPDFYYEESLKKGPGIYTNDGFKGQLVQ